LWTPFYSGELSQRQERLQKRQDRQQVLIATNIASNPPPSVVFHDSESEHVLSTKEVDVLTTDLNETEDTIGQAAVSGVSMTESIVR